MGVDDHLQRFGPKGRTPMPQPSRPEPAFDEEKLFSAMNRVAATANVVNKTVATPIPSQSDSNMQLRTEVKKLTESINDLLGVFRKAHEDIKAEPTADLSSKMDKLVEQNEEIARALLLLLELHREHLPQISKHTRVSSELRLRKPSRLLFTGEK